MSGEDGQPILGSMFNPARGLHVSGGTQGKCLINENPIIPPAWNGDIAHLIRVVVSSNQINKPEYATLWISSLMLRKLVWL